MKNERHIYHRSINYVLMRELCNDSFPTFSDLIDWLEGRLSPADVERIEHALENDADLDTEVAWLRQFAELSGKVALADPSPQVRTNLQAHFAEHVAANRPPTLWQWLTATLSFDSRQQLATSGVRRGELPPEKYQLLYTTNLADIVLSVEPKDKETHHLYGHVLPNGEGVEVTDWGVQLVQSGQDLGIVAVDEVGEFAFLGVNAGIYDFIINTGGSEIFVEGIRVE